MNGYNSLMRESYKTLTLIILRICVLAAFAAVFTSGAARAERPLYADLDGDGATESVRLQSLRESGLKQVCVYSADGESDYRSPPAKIWKLLLADADNDGAIEIALALTAGKKERPGEANGLHIFKWNGRDLVPVWRGSALSMPFRDVTFADWDGDGRTELLSLETNPKTGAANLVIYIWTGFGFGGTVVSPLPAGTTEIKLFAEDKTAGWLIKTKNAEALDCALSSPAANAGERGAAKTYEMKMDCRSGGYKPATEATAALYMNAARKEKGVAFNELNKNH